MALALLRDAPQGALGVSELARSLDLHKSTVHRLLTTLQRHGYVVQDSTTKRYRLGLAFLEFAHEVVERLEVRRHALRVMHALAEDSGASVYLNVLAGSGTLCVDEVVGPRGVTLGTNVGTVLPLHATAAGKCFLAWGGTDVRDRVLGREVLESVTPHTRTDHEVLVNELAQVLDKGHATNDEETEPGVRYVAAPIFDQEGDVVAAICLGVSVLRVSQAELPKLSASVMAAATRISASLGYVSERAPQERTS